MKSTVRPKSKSTGFNLFDFSFFGCNRPKSQVKQQEEPNSFKGLRHPSNCMQCPSGPTQASLNNDSDFNLNSLKVESPQLNGQSQGSSPFDQYPINEVFILGKQEKIIAKIIVRKISEAPQITSSLLSSVFGVFSQKETLLHAEGSSHQESSKGGSLSIGKIESNQTEKTPIHIEGLHDITPGNVARHIAHRLKCDVIIDALCGYGETSLQFAKFCNSVIAIGADPTKNSCAQQTFKDSKFNQKISFMEGDLVQIPYTSADIVFINPCVADKQLENFSIFKHIKSNLVQLLVRSLEITSKVALKLPGNTDLNEIVKLFNLAASQKNLPLNRFCIEIEQILNSSEHLEFILVFFGDCTSIDVKEECETAYNYLCCNESFECKANYSYQVVSALFETVGMYRTISYAMKLKEQNKSRGMPNAPVLESFLELLIKEKIYSREDLAKLVEEETKRRSSSLFNVIDSYESSLTCRDRKSTVFKNLNHYTEAEKASYLYQNNLTLDVNNLGKIQSDQTRSKKNEVFKWSSPYSPVPNFQGDLPEPAQNRRGDDSDLEISSYSVATDYLDDLDSEEYLSITRSRSMTQVFQLEKGMNSLIAESLLDAEKKELSSPIDNKKQTTESKL